MRIKKKLLAGLLLGVAVGASAIALSGCSDKNKGNNPSGGTDITDPDVPLDQGGCKHTDVDHVTAVTPGCVTGGNKEYWFCDDCDKYFADEALTVETSLAAVTLGAAGHTLGNLVEGRDATCLQTGIIAHYHCAVCNKDYGVDNKEIEDVIIPIGDHTYGDLIPEVPATTCDNGTKAHYHCSVCSTDFDENKEEFNGLPFPIGNGSLTIYAQHNLTTVYEKAASCEEDGVSETYRHCEDCGKNFDEVALVEKDVMITPAYGHTYGVIINGKDATCTEAGEVSHYHCAVCSKDFDADKKLITDLVIPAKGHNYGIWNPGTEATCTEDGVLPNYRCTVCKNNFDADKKLLDSIVIPALKHNYGEYVYDYEANKYVATCQNNGTHKLEQAAGVSAEFPYLVKELSELTYAIGQGGYIKLEADIKADVVVAKDVEVTLNLNGHTLSNDKSHTIDNSGTLTVMGGGTIYNGTHKKSALRNVGIATVNGVTLQRIYVAKTETTALNSCYVIDNIDGGVMTLIEATVLTVPSDNYSSLIRNMGATMTVESGTYTSGKISIKNDDEGVLTINGGTFNGIDKQSLQNWGVATINNGTFNGDISTCIWSADFVSKTIINDGTFGVLRFIYYESSNSSVAPVLNIANDKVANDPRIQIEDGNSKCYTLAKTEGVEYTEYTISIEDSHVYGAWSYVEGQYVRTCETCGEVETHAADGSEELPYVISSEAEWVSFAAAHDETTVTTDKEDVYYVVTSNLDFTNVTERVDVFNFSGTIDFNGHSVKGITETNTKYAYGVTRGLFVLTHDATIKNLNYELSYFGSANALAYPVLFVGRGDVVLDSVTVSGNATHASNNASAFVYFLWANAYNSTYVNPEAKNEGYVKVPDAAIKLTFKNCTNYANITNTGAGTSGYAAAYIGQVVANSAGNTVEFINCVNEGTITGYHYAAMLMANQCSAPNINTLTVENCVNNGKIYAGIANGASLVIGDTSNGSRKEYNDANSGEGKVVNGENGVTSNIAINALEIGEDGNFVINEVEGATTYKIEFVFSVRDDVNLDENGKPLHWGTTNITIDVNADSKVKALEFVDFQDVTGYEKNEFGIYVTADGNNYVITQTNPELMDLRMTAQPTIYLTAYNADGEVVGVSTCYLADALKA